MKFSWFLGALLFFAASRDTYLALGFGLLCGVLVEQTLWGVLWTIERLGALAERRKWRPVGAPPLTPCPGCRRREERLAAMRREQLLAAFPVQRAESDVEERV